MRRDQFWRGYLILKARYSTQRIENMTGRGALIVLEGCDRCGKSTQCRKLIEKLTEEGVKVELWRYPERSTAIGKVINDYLERKCELEDHAVHLLFSANRWESVPRMKQLLNSGTTLIVDRYAYSGVAFTAAKDDFNLTWCKQPDIGLPEPDLVLSLTLGVDEASKRGAFGEERYERTDFQQKVAKNFELLREKDWKIVDASRTIEEIHAEIREMAYQTMARVKNEKIGQLWVNQMGLKERQENTSPAVKVQKIEEVKSTHEAAHDSSVKT